MRFLSVILVAVLAVLSSACGLETVGSQEEAVQASPAPPPRAPHVLGVHGSPALRKAVMAAVEDWNTVCHLDMTVSEDGSGFPITGVSDMPPALRSGEADGVFVMGWWYGAGILVVETSDMDLEASHEIGHHLRGDATHVPGTVMDSESLGLHHVTPDVCP